jgi:hypothetical protein
MTHEFDCRQYVALTPGGHPFTETLVGDATTACALAQD